MRVSLFIPALLILVSCGGAQQGDAELKQVTVEQMSETRFAVSIEALNVDGYQMARCIAAAYTNSLRDKNDERLFDVYRRDGGKLTDEFRLKDGVRTQTVSGLQTYTLEAQGDHDGRDVMNVDQQLVVCERQGLPTKLGEG